MQDGMHPQDVDDFEVTPEDERAAQEDQDRLNSLLGELTTYRTQETEIFQRAQRMKQLRFDHMRKGNLFQANAYDQEMHSAQRTLKDIRYNIAQVEAEIEEEFGDIQ